ncbi:hypothetical protein [uncultured Sphingomonas sp.]|uniref:hypothetical protein n=1 Tax=uncultured Sphingomonas sp. TaxID=158754 RepID=UPI00260CB35B|nr:hypothetical protein [uncultured Sphingomonas sp.]
MRTIAIVACLGLVLLGGCGKKTMLKPAANMPLPVKPATSAKQPSVADLLTVGPQARPVRQDELVIKSAPLAPDRFDLPPPG